jgi:hypothetical protein
MRTDIVKFVTQATLQIGTANVDLRGEGGS